MERKTMNDDNILLLIVAGLVLFIGLVIGWSVNSDSWRQELVDKGFAEWHIVTGSRETEFKWKEKQ